jgi:hypothetical protein
VRGILRLVERLCVRQAATIPHLPHHRPAPVGEIDQITARKLIESPRR